jgi:hypothetical protein
MKKNMGTIDKLFRVFIAAVIGIIYFMGLINGTTAIILLVLAGVFLLTSLISTCPLYLPFGISTIKKEKK